MKLLAVSTFFSNDQNMQHIHVDIYQDMLTDIFLQFQIFKLITHPTIYHIYFYTVHILLKTEASSVKL